MRVVSSSRIARFLLNAALLSSARVAAADDWPTEAPTAPDPPPPPPGPAEGDLSQQPHTVETPEREPRGELPPAPPTGEPRVLIGALSLGPGWLAVRDKIGRDGQGATSLGARLGLVVAPEWVVFLGFERSSTERGGATFAQTAALFGAERYLFGRLYLGGGVAMAMVKESGVPDGLSDGPGFGFTALVGIEALRTRHAALTAEMSLTLAKYSKESWEMGGLRLGVNFF